MTTPSIQVEQAPSVQYLLRLADTALILGQRLGEWCGHAPVLEEDIALANIALDLIGQARAVLTRAGQLDGQGLTKTNSRSCATSATTATSRSSSCPTGPAAPATSRSPCCATR